jgi:hypothetical protein
MTNKMRFKIFNWWNQNRELILALGEDFALVIGFLCLCYGIYQIYKPIMWIFLGFGIMKLGGTK